MDLKLVIMLLMMSDFIDMHGCPDLLTSDACTIPFSGVLHNMLVYLQGMVSTSYNMLFIIVIKHILLEVQNNESKSKH